MKSWRRLDRSASALHGFIAELEDELWRRSESMGDAYQRSSPADFGKTPAGEALSAVLEAVSQHQRYALQPEERAAAVAYWHERLDLLGRFAAFRLRDPEHQRLFSANVRKCDRQTKAILRELEAVATLCSAGCRSGPESQSCHCAVSAAMRSRPASKSAGMLTSGYTSNPPADSGGEVPPSSLQH